MGLTGTLQRPFFAGLALALAAGSVPAAAQVSRDEALALVYPGATIAAERVFLTAAEVRDASARAGAPVDTPLVARYTASRGGVPIGRAYIDTHTVRTKKESLLVSLNADGTVRRIDVVAFLEPREFQAPEPFFGQFAGRRLDSDVQINRAIRPIAGATLTAHAVTGAVRRVLAIDAALAVRSGAAPSSASRP